MSEDEEEHDDEEREDDEATEGRPRLVPEDTHEGDVLVLASWAGTALLAIASIAAILTTTLEPFLVAVSLLLFLAGALLFFRAFAFAVSVRREDLIGIGGLFFLAGSAPRRIQVQLLGSFGAQVVIGLVTAAIRPYTALAFAVLASLYGLGLNGLWAAIHGTFPPRPTAEAGASRRPR